MNKKIEANTVMQGDVLKCLKQIPNNHVDITITSPPYWKLRDYGDINQIGQESTPQEYIKKIVDVSREIKRVLKPTGSFWLNIGDVYFTSNTKTSKCKKNIPLKQSGFISYNTFLHQRSATGIPDGKWLQSKQKLLLPYRIAIALQNDGWILRNEIIWYKPNNIPESVKDRLTKTHESLFFFVKSPKYYFDLNNIRKPLSLSTLQRYQYRNLSDKDSSYAGLSAHKKDLYGQRILKKYDELRKTISENDALKLLGSNPGDVWSIANEPLHENHFAAFPKKLVKRILRCACPPNGLVLDPFAGSGTSLLVAHNLCLNYLGIELIPEYCDIINKRIPKKLSGWKFT